MFSDHTPTPGLTEYKKAIEPVQVLGGSKKKVKIINRYDHATLDHLKCRWTMVGDGCRKKGNEVKIPAGIQPGETSELEIEGLGGFLREAYLELSFTLRKSTNWAEAGHEVAFGQIPLLPEALSFPRLKESIIKSTTAPKYTQITPQVLEIAGSQTVWQFNIVHGALASWKKAGQELIHSAPTLDFYRAVTDNDRPTRFGQSWVNSRLHQTKCHVRSVTWTSEGNGVVVKVESHIAPPVLAYAVETVFTYTFTDKHVSIKVSGKPRGINVPDTFARIGLTFSLNDIDTAQWFGRGPGEGYRDKKLSQRFGNYSVPVEELFTDYEFPQETGNRTDVRRVKFSGAKGGLTAHFGDPEGASFSALHYTTKDLDECEHSYELYKRKKKETIVRLDWAHHGIGTGSCGPATLPAYELKSVPFEYEVLLE